MNLTPVTVPADRRDVELHRRFAGEISQRERERAAIARKTDSEPPHLTCAWCPGFDPEAAGPGVSHGICPRCETLMHAQLDTIEASR